MKKRRIKCLVDYLEVNGIYNNEIYLYLSGGWTSLELATCTNCGEIFIYPGEELFFKKQTLKESTENIKCPKCNVLLGQMIEKYPDTFRTKNGDIGHKTYKSIHPEDYQVVDLDLYDLFS